MRPRRGGAVWAGRGGAESTEGLTKAVGARPPHDCSGPSLEDPPGLHLPTLGGARPLHMHMHGHVNIDIGRQALKSLVSLEMCHNVPRKRGPLPGLRGRIYI